MDIQCPNCPSLFRLPDRLAKPGAKLRCSVCKEVFQLPEEGDDDQDALILNDIDTDLNLDKRTIAKNKKSKKKKKNLNKKKSIFKHVMVIFVATLILVGAWYYLNYMHVPEEPVSTVTLEEKVSKLTMNGVRQYYVVNEKIGNIFVIEGKVVNGFSEIKELIEIEATLYGAEQNPLISKAQLAGTILSLFQLQVLGEKELESFLNNKIEVLSNNTNIRPGAEVPFMVIFYTPPEGIAEFGVKIIDVKDVLD